MDIYKEKIEREQLERIDTVHYDLRKKDSKRKPRIMVYENIYFNEQLSPNYLERMIQENSRKFKVPVGVWSHGYFYLIYRYFGKPVIFVDGTQSVNVRMGHWEITPVFYTWKENKALQHQAENQVCILLNLLKEYRMARFKVKSYSFETRWENRRRNEGLKLLWNYLDENKVLAKRRRTR
jgi:hypothetical protein